MRRVSFLCLAGAAGLVSIGSSAFADVQIGNWSNDTSDQWIDWGTQSGYAGGATSLPTPKYTFANPATGLNTPGSDSLLLTQAGFNQDLAIKLEYVTGGMAAFFANNAIQFNITIPAAAGTSGYDQFYQVALNAPGWGFNGLTASPVPQAQFNLQNTPQNLTITIPYTTALASIPSNAGYAEFILATNNGGSASTQYYFNSVSLVTVPEPATAALLLGGVGLPLLSRRRRRVVK